MAKERQVERVPETTSKIMKIDFKNDDGTVDEWVYDTTTLPYQVKQVTVGIRRRTDLKTK